MSVPNVDTFEHDIAEEIRTKEASLTDIASAGGDIQNATPVQTSNLLVIIGLIFVVAVIAGVAWLLYMQIYPGTSATQPATATTTNPGLTIESFSPTIANAVGPSLGKVKKSEYGYVIPILSYSQVYSYMLRNENAYADELARNVGSPRDTSTTSLPFAFTDETISNQNMRVGTSGSSTVVYAFANGSALIISSSTSGILELRGGILSK